jgi:hypothetical protein
MKYKEKLKVPNIIRETENYHKNWLQHTQRIKK